MRLTRFKAKNIFSLGEVDLDLDKRGLLLVTGHSIDDGGANGSGKSSLSSKGLLWTMYGISAAGERADAVINRFTPEGESSEGIVELVARSGSHYRITRSRSPNRLCLVNVDTGEDISCKQEKDTQELVNAILGRSKETFLQTDFFGQGKQASFLDLTPKAQIEVLEKILPFDQINALANDTKRNLAKLTIIANSVNKHTTETQGKVMEAQNSERQLSESVDKWERSQEATIARLKTEIKKAEAENNLTNAIEAIQKEIEDILTKPEAEALLVSTTANLKDCLETKVIWSNAIKDWRAEKDSIVVPAAPSVDSICPTCDTPIGQVKYARLVQEYAAAQSKLNYTNTMIAECEFTQEHVENISQSIRGVKADAEQALRRHAEIEAKIAKLEADRNSLKTAILKESLLDTQEAVNPYLEMYDRACSNVKTLTTTLGFHKRREEEVQKDKSAMEFWQSAFNKDLKNELIKSCCNFLQEKAIIHLEGLGNAQLKVKVETTKVLKSSDERSEFTVSAYSTTGSGTYEGLSGGERQLINFAFGLALSGLAELQTDGPSYLMILDEPLVALDARNSENFVNYLNTYLTGKKETILLVSNEESLKTLIPNRVMVVKENGVSRLETNV
jgi:DNA repair exonuclease SbcCD ATPase subunit